MLDALTVMAAAPVLAAVTVTEVLHGIKINALVAICAVPLAAEIVSPILVPGIAAPFDRSSMVTGPAVAAVTWAENSILYTPGREIINCPLLSGAKSHPPLLQRQLLDRTLCPW